MCDESQILVCRQNSFRSNEPTDLKDEREEGGKINTAKGSQEKPAWNQAVKCAMLRVEQPADGGRNPFHERQQLYRQERNADLASARRQRSQTEDNQSRRSLRGYQESTKS